MNWSVASNPKAPLMSHNEAAMNTKMSLWPMTCIVVVFVCGDKFFFAAK